MSLDCALPDLADLARQTRQFISAGRSEAARPLIGALRRFAFPAQAVAELEARLLMREGRSLEARDVLDSALADASSLSSGERAPLHLLRAELRLEAGNTLHAADDAAAAVIACPRDGHAKAMLGAALIRLGQAQDAATCLREACAADPRPGFNQLLAEAEELSGNTAAAAATRRAAVAAWPSHVALRTASIMGAMRRGDFSEALDIAQAACAAGLGDAAIFGLLGHALSSLGRHEEAIEAYAEALKLAPEDVYVRHLVSAAGIGACAKRAPAAYVEAVFDGYADRFDEHLIALRYRVPGLILKALQKREKQGHSVGRILDLGCGTGLFGLVATALGTIRLEGVDLSGQMLARAREKGCYDRLTQADVADWLGSTDESWDAIVAADVLTYFGDLQSVLRDAAARLAPGGCLAFSVEEMPEQLATRDLGWHLHRQGRYCHSEAYLRSTADVLGLRVRRMDQEEIRLEGGIPVSGLIVLLDHAR